MRHESFFMVVVDGGESPKYKHPNFDSAQTEAKRLAKITGRPAYVLQSILKVELSEFVLTAMDCNELPF